MKKSLYKKGLIFGIIALFVGVSIAPSLNASESKDNELFEITTEIFGLNSGNHAVYLTKEELTEIEQLIDDIEKRLNEADTREKAVEIFKEALAELDEYDLLKGLSIKQIERIVNRYNGNLKLAGFFNRFFMNEINEENDVDNILCLVSTSVVDAYSRWFVIALFMFLSYIPLEIVNAVFYYTLLKPFCLFLTIFGQPIMPNAVPPEVLSYRSIGLNGIKRGGEWGTIFGFTGVKITIIKENSHYQWYFGFALAVRS